MRHIIYKTQLLHPFMYSEATMRAIYPHSNDLYKNTFQQYIFDINELACLFVNLFFIFL